MLVNIEIKEMEMFKADTDRSVSSQKLLKVKPPSILFSVYFFYQCISSIC